MDSTPCPICGEPLAPGLRACPRCGTEPGDAAPRTAAHHAASAADAGFGRGWFRAALLVLLLLFIASGLAVLHLQLNMR